MSQNEKPIESTPQPPRRKPYSPPQVISYGHVKDIVQGAGGNGLDSGGGHSKACWIAEALYGADDPRTHLLRAWVTMIYNERRRGWLLVGLYRMFGRSTATLITRGLLPRMLFQPLFDTLVEKALADSAPVFVAARH